MRYLWELIAGWLIARKNGGEYYIMRGERWRDASDVGSCNFCHLGDYRKVIQFGVLRGEWYGGEVLVRICRKCLDALKKLAKE